MGKSYRKTKATQSSRRYNKGAPATAAGSIKWTVIGIFVGLIVAVVIFWEYAPELAGGVNKLKPDNIRPAHLKTITKKETTTQPTTAASQAHAPQFDFYTMLPQMQVAPNTQATTQRQQPPPNMPPTMATATVPAAAAPVTAQTTAAPAAETQPAAPASTPTVTPSMVTNAEASTLGETTTTPAAADTNNNKPTTPLPSESVAQESDQTISYILQVASVKDYHVADRLKAELTMMGYNVTIQKSLVNGQPWNRVNVGPYSSKKVALEKQQALHENNISSMLIKQS